MEKVWKVVLAFVGVFIAGAVFGGFLSLGISRRMMQDHLAAQPALTPKITATPPPQPPPEKRHPGQGPQLMGAPQLMRIYVNRLDLTAEQKERLRPIIQRAAEDYRRQQVNHLRETGFILQRLQQDIKKELTPEQQAKLEQLEQKQRETLKENRLPGAKPPGPKPGKNAPDAPATPAPDAKATPPATSPAPATNPPPAGPPAPPPAGDEKKKDEKQE